MTTITVEHSKVPYPNQHSARISDPKSFKKGSFRTVTPKPGVHVIIGKKKGQEKTSAQAVRYDRRKYSAGKAKASLKKHGIKLIEFSKATGKESIWCPILEQADAAVRPTVDRENGIIRGLCILGPESRDRSGKLRRVYTRSCIQESVRLYEGVKVNIDHPVSDNGDRELDKRFGKFVNVRENNGRLYGDLEFLKTHPMAERVCEAATSASLKDICGFSHDADIDVEWKDGCQIVSRIKLVRSVDLVADPATTHSLFESQRTREMKDTCEEVPTGSEVSGVTEAPPPDGGGTTQEPIDAVISALLAKFKAGEIDVKDLKKKIGKAIDLFVDEEPSPDGGDGEGGDAGGGKDADGGKESAKCSVDDGMAVLEAAGVPVTRVRLKAVRALHADQERKDLADTWKGVPVAESTVSPKSTAGPKPASSPKIQESTKTGEFDDLTKIRTGMFRR